MSRLRGARAHVVLAVGLAAAALGGCGDRAQRQYSVADRLLDADKPELAVVEFERFLQAHPNSELAPAAHYKLAWLYRVHLNSPGRAIAHYRDIAIHHAHSRYADDALLRLASMGRLRRDLAMVREAVDRMERDHATRPAACAQVRIQLALALLDASSPGTKAICRSILTRYPQQKYQCAEAELILARAIEKIDRNPEAAVKAYEKLSKAYPETRSSVQAQQRIGWIYYGRSRDARNQPAAGAKKRLAGVPAFAHGPDAGIQVVTLDALGVLLRQRQAAADTNALMAVSGAAFQFVYDANNRTLGSGVFATNPLETSAAGFGFSPLKSSSANAEEAMLSLCQTLDRGRPVMVPHRDGRWVVVVGYDQTAKQFIYLGPGAGERTAGFDEFAAAWKAEVEQYGGQLDPFYQFALGPGTPASAATRVREAASRGASLAQRTSVFGAPAGLTAYEALIADLEKHGAGPLPADAAALAAWAGEPLTLLRRSREAAGAFFGSTAGSLAEPSASTARATADTYRTLTGKLGDLGAGFPKPPDGAAAGTDQPEYAAAAHAAAQTAREALELERKAAEQLAALAGG